MRKLIKSLPLLFIFSILLSSCEDGNEIKEAGKIKIGEKKETKKVTEKKETKEQTFDLSNKGIGPIKSVELSETIDEAMVAKGAEVYKLKCTACHKIGKKFIGPAANGILERRSPEWIMNMILNPDEMVKKDPIAKQLLADYNFSPMANQNLTEEEARQILEYFRTLK
jgi:mono/diheme cytochrome c family protein